MDNSKTEFRHELFSLLNKYSKENGSNTPDFILADYLVDCLAALDKLSNKSAEWHTNGCISASPVRKIEIDLTHLVGPLITFERGATLRKDVYSLDKLDAENYSVHVIIPDLCIMSYSFFRGLFGPSVLRSKDFKQRYKFTAPLDMLKMIDQYTIRFLDRVMMFPELSGD